VLPHRGIVDNARTLHSSSASVAKNAHKHRPERQAF
jgi:hypothetical protein